MLGSVLLTPGQAWPDLQAAATYVQLEPHKPTVPQARSAGQLGRLANCPDCPLAARSPFLLSCSEAALVPFASQAALADPGPLYACLAVNAWLVLALSVALPLSLLRLLERRSAAGHPAQQPSAERAAEQLKEQAAGAWPVRAFLRSSLLWSAVALVLRAWQAAAPGSLLSMG